jgi:hypothetical protein
MVRTEAFWIHAYTDSHEATIGAFCRNYGSWETAKVPYREWNLELIEAMVVDMSLAWDRLSEGFDDTVDYINDAIKTEVRKIGSEVEGL